MKRFVWLAQLISILTALPAFAQVATLQGASFEFDGPSCQLRLRVKATFSYGGLNFCGVGNACDQAVGQITVTGPGAPYPLVSTQSNATGFVPNCPQNPTIPTGSTLEQVYSIPANTQIRITVRVSQVCNGVTESYSTKILDMFTPGTQDEDGDGVLSCRDCNDHDPNTYPGAAEECDGEDNNCDGADDNSSTDADGDGIDSCEDCNDQDPLKGQDGDGDGANDCEDCDDGNASKRPGLNADGDPVGSCSDCADNDPNNYPGNEEVCDKRDNNCNDLVDENLCADKDKCDPCCTLGAHDPVNFVSGAMSTLPQRDVLLKGINGLDVDFHRIYQNQVREELPLEVNTLVTGTVIDRRIQTVQVNGIATDVVNGAWERELLLVPGLNTVTVTAILDGVPLQESIQVTAIPTSRFGMGVGWTHAYNIYLQHGLGGGVRIQDAKGRNESFRPDGLGGYLPNNGSRSRLVAVSGGGFQWIKSDGSTYTFDANGFLTRMSDRFANAITFTYQANRLATITDTVGRVLTFSYTASANLDRITGPAGVLARYTYDSQGNLATATNSAGEITTYAYQDPNDPYNLTSITNDAGQTILTVQYDTQDRTISITEAGGVNALSITYNAPGDTTVTNSKGEITAYSLVYNPSTGTGAITATGVGCATCNGGNLIARDIGPNYTLTRTVDRNGQVTTYTYDSRGNVLTKTEAFGTPQARTTTYTYHPTFDFVLTETVTSVLDGAQFRRVTYDYDDDGNTTPNEAPGLTIRRQIIEGLTRNASGALVPIQQITRMDYTASGLPTLTDGPRTDVVDTTVSSYYPIVAGDAKSGMLQSVTQNNGGTQLTTTYDQYDAFGNVGRITDPNGQITLYTYDALNRVLTVTHQADSSATTNTYDANGNLDTVTLPNGNTLDYTYDAANRLTQIRDALGNSIQYSYDTEGNRTREERRDPANVIQSFLNFQYDTLNRLEHATNPDATFTQYGYDAGGNRTSLTDPNGRVTTYQYDALNRLTSMTQPGSVVTGFVYDSQDHLTRVTDAQGNVTTYEYDDLGRLLRTVSPDTGTTTYAYDVAGNLTSKTDAKNIVTTYDYDALNRLTQIRFPDASQNITYSYDSATAANGRGQITGMTDPSGLTAYAYTTKGQLSQQTTTPTGLSGLSFTTAYSYDANGNLTGMTYPDGRQVTYGFDAADRLTQVAGTLNNQATTFATVGSYLPYGPYRGVTMGNGLATGATYDQRYRLSTLSVSGVGPQLQNHQYTYDATGNITAITDGLTATNNKTYGYDVLDRLTSATGPWGTPTATINYTYDGVGNRLTEGGTLGSSTYAYDANQLTDVTGTKNLAFTYDPNGNTVTENTRAYVYDQNNRLIRVTENAVTIGNYLYDGQGRRVRKIASGETTYFLYDQQSRLIAEADDTGGLTAEYLWLPDRPLAKLQAGADTPSVPAAPTGFAAAPGDRQLFLTWNAAAGTGIQGYRIRYGTAAGTVIGDYPNMIDVGNVTSYPLTGLVNGVTYHLIVTAYNTVGESNFLPEIQAVPNPTDSDNDGLPDTWELQHGLNPNNPADANLDGDGDGFTNLQEYAGGTDPTDDQSSPTSATTLDNQNRPIRLVVPPGVQISAFQWVNPSTLPAPPSGTLPFGLVSIRLQVPQPSDSATVALTFPGAVSTTASYGKYGPTAADTTNHWYTVPFGNNNGDATITLTLTDGGSGDHDLVANAIIDDPGGPLLSTASKLIAISTRARVQTVDNVMIGGFYIGGTTPKTVMLRARGPSLGAPPFSNPGVLANPTMQLYSGSTVIAQNDNWGITDPLCLSPATACGGVPEITATGNDPCQPNPGQPGAPPNCAQESAIYITLPPGGYTAIVRGVNGTIGMGLVEVFEVDSSPSPLVAISTRARVETADNVMIGGFFIGGTDPKQVLIRARGGSLGGPPFNNPGVLLDPALELYSGSTKIAENDDWPIIVPLCGAPAVSCGTPTEITATGVDPCQPNPGQIAAPPGCVKEAALLMTLPPGGYTAIVRGVNGTSGMALVEIFEVTPGLGLTAAGRTAPVGTTPATPPTAKRPTSQGVQVAALGDLSGLALSGSSETAVYYHTNHLGTPLFMTNTVGQVVWRAELLPFGEPFAIDEDVDGDGARVTNDLRFPGQYVDQETRLHYNWFRHYDPEIGRYNTTDPVGFLGGINIYLYGLANPVTQVDPQGLDTAGCDIPLIGNLITAPAILECCATHDRCYDDFNCSSASWISDSCCNAEECDSCNRAVVGCIVVAIVFNPFKDDPSRPNYYCARQHRFISVPGDFPDIVVAREACRYDHKQNDDCCKP